jgi:fructosamine-3-kinase
MLTDVPSSIQEQLTANLKTELKNFSFCSGGCINSGGKLETTSGNFFLKWNDRKKFGGMFEAEAKGLTLLNKPGVIRIPRVLTSAETDTQQFLLLEFIETKQKSNSYWTNLGLRLALLHQNSAAFFGLNHDNYIGSLKQSNQPGKNWIGFFIEQRLEVQLKLAIDNKRASHDILQLFQSLYKKLPDLLPDEQPALLHGDLWSGNLIIDDKGEPCLIDPAVYYGNRETEIAFTRLFGGFSHEFYGSYNENLPLIPGFADRTDVYNLYPLMVHVNLFGGSYLSQVVSILRRFV